MYETFLVWVLVAVLVIVVLFLFQKRMSGKFVDDYHPHKDAPEGDLLKPGDERRGKFWRAHSAPSDHMHEKVRKQKLLRG